MYVQAAVGGGHWQFVIPLCRVAPLRPGWGGSLGSLGLVEVAGVLCASQEMGLVSCECPHPLQEQGTWHLSLISAIHFASGRHEGFTALISTLP